MNNTQIFIEVMNKIGASPALKCEFSTEQLNKYSVMSRRLVSSSKPFRIVFCGVFSSGKTSLISSLLDFDELKLPVGINPVTKMITRIRYGSTLTCSYKLSGNKIFMSPSEMKEVVQGKKKISADNNEIFITVPSKFLMGNVEIIDTPGLNDEAGELERISRAAIYESDMAVLCCNALMLGKIIEKDLLQELENITGHFSLIITRIDNINNMESYEDIMSQAQIFMKGLGDSAKIFKGAKDFVFPVVAAGKNKHVEDFRQHIISIISNKSRMLKIQEVSVRKSTALYLSEICSVTDRTLLSLRASCNKLVAANRRAIRNQELESQMKVSAFENMRGSALDAAAAFTVQRIASLRTSINGLNNPFTFQNDAKKCSDQAVKQIISDLANYARSKSISGCESVSYNFTRAFETYSYAIPKPVIKRVKKRGVLGQTLFTALDFIESVVTFDFDLFSIDDGYDYYYDEYHEPAINAFWDGPAAWLADQWKNYIERSGRGIKTSGFIGGYETKIKNLENSIAQCESVKMSISG